MGLPLGPTLANIFMCHHEDLWLSSCPAEFKPLLYRRYIDDCFVLFRNREQSVQFFNYINNKHANIRFTMEHESNNCLSFLDVNVQRCHSGFQAAVYRKPTFTGLGMSFFSFIPHIYKLSVIKTLLYRAYNLSSTYQLFDKEVNFLRQFFNSNGFPDHIFYSTVKQFLNKIFSEKRSPQILVPKLPIFVKIPYFGYQSTKLKSEIHKIIDKYFSYVDLKVILINNFKISNFFKFKDKLPLGCESSVIYSYSCTSCDVSYVGSTIRTLQSRVDQHAGRSHRTGRPLSVTSYSSIRNHCDSVCKTNINVDNFKILDRNNNEQDLRILESLYIHNLKPKLNEMAAASQLHIVN